MLVNGNNWNKLPAVLKWFVRAMTDLTQVQLLMDLLSAAIAELSVFWCWEMQKALCNSKCVSHSKAGSWKYMGCQTWPTTTEPRDAWISSNSGSPGWLDLNLCGTGVKSQKVKQKCVDLGKCVWTVGELSLRILSCFLSLAFIHLFYYYIFCLCLCWV